MLVRDVMTKSPICCEPIDKLDRVARLMRDQDCGVVPVCDGTKLVGVITDRDITCRGVASGKVPAAVAAADVMTKTVFSIRDDENAEAAIDLMKEKQVRRLPVLDDAGYLVGIVSPSDLAPLFASEHVADFLLAVSYWNRRKVVAA
ncbi:MAG: CBS domain-containing protein [Thermoanaerobaculia bacterium]